ncbi:hypothetical protein ACFX15_008002 [Malus domestica]
MVFFKAKLKDFGSLGLIRGEQSPRDGEGTLRSTSDGRLPWNPKAATECTKVAYGFRKTAYGLPFEQ